MSCDVGVASRGGCCAAIGAPQPGWLLTGGGTLGASGGGTVLGGAGAVGGPGVGRRSRSSPSRGGTGGGTVGGRGPTRCGIGVRRSRGATSRVSSVGVRWRFGAASIGARGSRVGGASTGARGDRGGTCSSIEQRRACTRCLVARRTRPGLTGKARRLFRHFLGVARRRLRAASSSDRRRADARRVSSSSKRSITSRAAEMLASLSRARERVRGADPDHRRFRAVELVADRRAVRSFSAAACPLWRSTSSVDSMIRASSVAGSPHGRVERVAQRAQLRAERARRVG